MAFSTVHQFPSNQIRLIRRELTHCLSHGRKCHYNYDLYSWLDPSWIRHGWLPTDDVQQVMVPLELFVVVVVAAAAAGDIMLSLGGGLGFEAGLEVAWMLLLSVHRMMSLPQA
jgi:hypothetical protein